MRVGVGGTIGPLGLDSDDVKRGLTEDLRILPSKLGVEGAGDIECDAFERFNAGTGEFPCACVCVCALPCDCACACVPCAFCVASASSVSDTEAFDSEIDEDDLVGVVMDEDEFSAWSALDSAFSALAFRGVMPVLDWSSSLALGVVSSEDNDTSLLEDLQIQFIS